MDLAVIAVVYPSAIEARQLIYRDADGMRGCVNDDLC